MQTRHRPHIGWKDRRKMKWDQDPWGTDVRRILEPHQACARGLGAMDSEETCTAGCCLGHTVGGWNTLTSLFSLPPHVSTSPSHWQNPAKSQLTSECGKGSWMSVSLQWRAGEEWGKGMRENGPRAAEVTTVLVFEFCLTGWGCSNSYLKLHHRPSAKCGRSPRRLCSTVCQLC